MLHQVAEASIKPAERQCVWAFRDAEACVLVTLSRSKPDQLKKKARLSVDAKWYACMCTSRLLFMFVTPPDGPDCPTSTLSCHRMPILRRSRGLPCRLLFLQRSTYVIVQVHHTPYILVQHYSTLVLGTRFTPSASPSSAAFPSP